MEVQLPAGRNTATATVADGTEQQRYNGTAQRNGEMATAEWQWNGGNQAQR